MGNFDTIRKTVGAEEGESALDKAKTCCFTGHRPNKMPWGDNEEDARCVALKKQIDAALRKSYENGKRHFICGMALGADMYFCEAVLALRDELPGITVEAALPCEEQAARWKEQDRKRYFSLIERCDLETMVQHRYDRQCMQRRDRYMVDRSSLVIAAYAGYLGGTMYTLQYAMRQGVETVILDIDKK